MSRRRRSLRQAGQAVVEFALIALIFFGLMCGIVDFGRGIWYYNTLSNATREGARYGTVLHVVPETGAVVKPSCSDIKAHVRALAVGIQEAELPDTNIGCVFGVYPSDPTTATLVKVTPNTSATPIPRPTAEKPQNKPYYIAVSAVYDFHLVTPIISNIIDPAGTGIRLTSNSMMVTSF